MDADRRILHVDMDAFFASVEQLDDPSLRGRPVLVGGAGRRGVVAAASYEARAFGCRSAMPTAMALRQCPHAVVVRGRGERYRELSRAVFGILEDFTPLVQPLSIDEAFLDLTGTERLHGTARDAATAIRARIRAETGLTASVGIAWCKHHAKLASDLEKPDGLCELVPADLEGRLAALPIERLWGVGEAATKRFHRVGIRTFGDLQRLTEADAVAALGPHGAHARRLALGDDPRPVHRDREAKSIGSERTFGQDLERLEDVRAQVVAQCEEVAYRLRRHERLARTVVVKIRFGDFETITRSCTLDEPTDLTDRVREAALGLLGTWARGGFRPVRLVGVTCSNLVEPGGAPAALFGAEDAARRRRLDAATDRIRDRFGRGTIGRGLGPPRRGSGVGREPRE